MFVPCHHFQDWVCIWCIGHAHAYSIISSVPRNTLLYSVLRVLDGNFSAWKSWYHTRYKLPDPYLESLIPRVLGLPFSTPRISILIILVSRPGFNADEFFNGNKDGRQKLLFRVWNLYSTGSVKDLNEYRRNSVGIPLLKGFMVISSKAPEWLKSLPSILFLLTQTVIPVLYRSCNATSNSLYRARKLCTCKCRTSCSIQYL